MWQVCTCQTSWSSMHKWDCYKRWRSKVSTHRHRTEIMAEDLHPKIAPWRYRSAPCWQTPCLLTLGAGIVTDWYGNQRMDMLDRTLACVGAKSGQITQNVHLFHGGYQICHIRRKPSFYSHLLYCVARL